MDRFRGPPSSCFFYIFNAGWLPRSLFNSPVVTRD